MQRAWCITTLIHHAATHCNRLQHTVTRFSTLYHTAAHCSKMQHNALQCTTPHHYHSVAICTVYCYSRGALNRNTLQHNATHYDALNTLQHTSIRCITLQHTATHYSNITLLQCVMRYYSGVTYCNTPQNTATRERERTTERDRERQGGKDEARERDRGRERERQGERERG